MKLTKGAIQAIAREIIRKARTQQDNVIEGLKTNEVVLSLVDSDLKLFAKMSAGGKKYFGRNNSTEEIREELIDRMASSYPLPRVKNNQQIEDEILLQLAKVKNINELDINPFEDGETNKR